MYIGLGIFLLVIGGILRYAVSVDIPGISVHGIGGVLLWGGILSLFLSGIQSWAGRQITARRANAVRRAQQPRPTAPPPGYVDERTWVHPSDPDGSNRR
ncbi:MAG: phage holin family protein [Phycicoccus sp.]|nr:phage holin family protein [Phycicoccus sp.]